MKILIGNWKMAPDTLVSALDLAKKTAQIAKTHKKDLEIIVAVPFPHIYIVSKVSKILTVGAQSLSGATALAVTGGVSAGMLKSYGVTHAIVGHSESRARGDSNDVVAEQIKRLLEKKIIPILCIGEKTRDTHGWYLSVIKDQIESALLEVPKATFKRFIIAYEPVWAIGADATREATPEECREIIIFIRKIIADLYDEKIASLTPILYGGSVNETNAQSFMQEGGASGLLVGRVSLDPKRFAKIAESITKI
jgi:triosephosphate isomerase